MDLYKRQGSSPNNEFTKLKRKFSSPNDFTSREIPTIKIKFSEGNQTPILQSLNSKRRESAPKNRRIVSPQRDFDEHKSTLSLRKTEQNSKPTQRGLDREEGAASVSKGPLKDRISCFMNDLGNLKRESGNIMKEIYSLKPRRTSATLLHDNRASFLDK